MIHIDESIVMGLVNARLGGMTGLEVLLPDDPLPEAATNYAAARCLMPSLEHRLRKAGSTSEPDRAAGVLRVRIFCDPRFSRQVGYGLPRLLAAVKQRLTDRALTGTNHQVEIERAQTFDDGELSGYPGWRTGSVLLAIIVTRTVGEPAGLPVTEEEGTEIEV